MKKSGGGVYLSILGLMAGFVLSATALADVPTHKTTIQFDFSAAKELRVSSGVKQQPPAIVLDFKSRNVKASFPETSEINSPVIQSIITHYAREPRPGQSGTIDTIEIVMTDAFKHRVWTEQGNVYVELHHPDLPSGAGSGRASDLVINGEQAQFDQRFKAMQEALNLARTESSSTGTAVTNGVRVMPAVTASTSLAPALPESAGAQAAVELMPGTTKSTPPPVQVTPEHVAVNRAPTGIFTEQEQNRMLVYAGLLLLLLCMSVANRSLKERPYLRVLRNEKAVLSGFGNRFLSELVWQAFERQGYQLISEIELSGTGDVLRVVIKDGKKSGLMCLSSGVFYERQVIHRFVKALNEVHLKKGFLAATGSFTVPAQRLAKENNVQLIARSQLIELLSIGATSEYVTRQLEKSAEELKQTKQTLAIYAQELDTLRRQRNEASWYLGGERVKTTKLQAQLDGLTQQLAGYEKEIGQWQEEVRSLQKHWEESEWYLGESRMRVEHLESQLQAMGQSLQAAEHVSTEVKRESGFTAKQRSAELESMADSLEKTLQKLSRLQTDYDQAQWFLGEERSKITDLEAELIGLRHAQEDAAKREGALKDQVDLLSAELKAIRDFGERRQNPRFFDDEIAVEMNGFSEEPVFVGCPRDISGSGMRVESEQQLPSETPLNIRFQLPGSNDTVDSRAEVVWQHASIDSAKFQSGWKFIDVPEPLKEHLAAVKPSRFN